MGKRRCDRWQRRNAKVGSHEARLEQQEEASLPDRPAADAGRQCPQGFPAQSFDDHRQEPRRGRAGEAGHPKHGPALGEGHHGSAQVGVSGKNPGCNRAILDQGWGMFGRFLGYKLPERGGIVVEVPARNSSRECSACGFVDERNRKGLRFICVGCGHAEHADTNASKVIKRRWDAPLKPVEGHRARRPVEAGTTGRAAARQCGRPPEPRAFRPKRGCKCRSDEREALARR